MPRTSTVRKGGNNLVSEIKNTFSNVEPLTYICCAVIILYMILAKPSNTPSFFRNSVFKGVLFVIVFLIILKDPVIGILFGLAMVLSVCYSNKNNQEGFYSPDDEEGVVDEEGNICHTDKPCLHDNPNDNTCFEKSNGVCPAGTTDQF